MNYHIEQKSLETQLTDQISQGKRAKKMLAKVKNERGANLYLSHTQPKLNVSSCGDVAIGIR